MDLLMSNSTFLSPTNDDILPFLTSITALHVARNDHPKIIGILSSFSMSKGHQLGWGHQSTLPRGIELSGSLIEESSLWVRVFQSQDFVR